MATQDWWEGGKRADDLARSPDLPSGSRGFDVPLQDDYNTPLEE